MSPVHLRWSRDVALALVGMGAVLAGVALLVDGVESARLLGQGVRPAAWLALVLAAVPGRLAALLPVAAAVSAGWVTSRWLASGRLVAAAACGLGLRRLAAASALAVFLVSLAFVGAREGVTPHTARLLAPRAAWVLVEAGEAPVLASAEALVGDRVREVRVASLWRGELVGMVAAPFATWSGTRWVAPEATMRWGTGTLEPLPPPERWRDLALRPDAEAPLATLWRAHPSPSRTAWFWGRLLDPLLAALLALATPTLVCRGRWGAAGVVGAAALFRLVQGGAVAAVAVGAWPAWLGLGLPVLALGIVALAAWAWSPS